MKMRTASVVALGLLAAACGTNPTDRTTGGAAAGAATGAAVGALGGPPGALAGAAIGGGVGAVTGAVTTPDQVNLGRPVWNDPEVRVGGERVASSGSRSGSRSGMAASSGQTRQIQQALASRGFDPGPIDGRMGPQTRQAIMDYQRQNNMQATGRADSQMLSSLGVAGGAGSGMSRTGGTAQNDRDRAFQGGGMAVDQNRGMTGGTTTGAGTTTRGATGGGVGSTVRPDPSGGTSGVAVPSPSNNPLGDPTGGSGAGNRPGFNNNRDGGSNR